MTLEEFNKVLQATEKKIAGIIKKLEKTNKLFVVKNIGLNRRNGLIVNIRVEDNREK